MANFSFTVLKLKFNYSFQSLLKCYRFVSFSEVISQSPPDAANNSGEGWLSYLNTVVTASASYLPMTETLLQGRAFATVHHNQPGMRNICALAM
jgi:hypothetical protein